MDNTSGDKRTDETAVKHGPDHSTGETRFPHNCGRNIPGNNVTTNDDIAMSNDNVQHAIKANAKNNIDIHNDNLITISISNKQYTALIARGANLNCISTETLNNCPQKYQNKMY